MSTEGPICRRVLLVRHGHYDRTGDAGDDVWELSALGRRQAVRVGKRLARVRAAASGRFEGIYTSPWPRARQTAEIVAHEMELESVRIKPYLHEAAPLIDPSWLDPQAVHMGLTATSSTDRERVVRRVGKIRDRFMRAPKRAGLVIVVCHGNLIRYLVAHTLGLPYEGWAHMDIAHTGISEIRIYTGEFEALISYNETGHLPPSMITTN